MDNESLTLNEAQRYAFIKNAAAEIGIEDEKKTLTIEKHLASIVLNNIVDLKSLDRMETKSIINSKSIANRTPIDSNFEIYVKSNDNSIVSLGSNDFSGSNVNEDIIAKIKEESYNTLFTSTTNERTYYFTISTCNNCEGYGGEYTIKLQYFK